MKGFLLCAPNNELLSWVITETALIFAKLLGHPVSCWESLGVCLPVQASQLLMGTLIALEVQFIREIAFKIPSGMDSRHKIALL